MRKHRTANEELFALVLERWQSLPSEREKASFFVDVVLRDERFTDLLPFMVDAALKELERNEAGRSGASPSRLSAAKEKNLRETFWAATDEWNKEHPGSSGLGDAQKAWRYAVGRAAARTHADPKTVKRRFPDPVEKARARVRAHVQALREGTPRK
jgi:hypothetical protein